MLRSILSLRQVASRGLSYSLRSAAEQPTKEEIDELFADDTKPKVFRGFSRNSVELIGDVTDEPMRKVTMKDHPYALFQVVTNNRIRTANGEYRDMNEVHTVQVFGKRLEFALNNVRKGGNHL
uniref:Uncharacterized protein n=1 Tax=Heterorhabditis bacteriophora TaxID=37862 RepID=A0A1I7XTH5_HETBA